MNYDKAEQSACDQGFDAAYACAQSGQEKRNPFRNGSWLFSAWEDGFLRAAEEINLRYRDPNS